MISVKVHTIYDIKKIIGKREINISVREKATLGEMLDEMVLSWGQDLSTRLFDPKSNEVLPHIHIMINGQDFMFLNGTATVLSDGDEIIIAPSVFGG